MTPEIFDVLNKYGIPGWALLLIGGGTIVAAIISSINALAVAVINARAAKRVAIYNAHREYRATLCAPVLRRFREMAVFSLRIRRARVRSHAELVKQYAEWTTGSQEVEGNKVAVFIPDETLTTAGDFAMRRYSELRQSLRLGTTGTDDSATMKIALVREAARGVLIGCEAVELAAEGYVFELRRSSTRASLRMWRFRIHQFIERSRLGRLLKR